MPASPARLTAEPRTNRCHEPFPVTIRELTTPAIGPVAAGSTTDFTKPIAPVSTRVDLPPGASGHSEVLNLGGRPAQLKFVAPTVTAPVDVTFDMTFGAELFHRKTITTTVRVEPAP